MSASGPLQSVVLYGPVNPETGVLWHLRVLVAGRCVYQRWLDTTAMISAPEVVAHDTARKYGLDLVYRVKPKP